MPMTPSIQSYVLEQLGRAVPVTSRRMFGAVGIYSDGRFFAILDEDRLYFKVDDSSRPEFERAGMGPFRPYGDARSMQYFEVPIDVLEDPDELRLWAGRAIRAAAKRAR